MCIPVTIKSFELSQENVYVTLDVPLPNFQKYFGLLIKATAFRYNVSEFCDNSARIVEIRKQEGGCPVLVKL